MSKTALICGVSGQDGAYLAHLLLTKRYNVIGTSRDISKNSFLNLEKLDIKSKIITISMNFDDIKNIIKILDKYEPVEIYNLSGQSSVSLSFAQPAEAFKSISLAQLNLLEAVRVCNRNIRIFNAGSGEVFGDTGCEPANEETPFKPRSPYAVAKANGYWKVANYREVYDIFACTGLLFNHESSLRQQQFVTQKIISGAKQIASGNLNSIVLGNLNIVRDWGWAPEYVEAMWLMLQNPCPGDYIIATGTSSCLREFTEKILNHFGLKFDDHVQIDNSLFRPVDIKTVRADPSKAKNQLGWKSKVTLDELIKKMSNSLLF